MPLICETPEKLCNARCLSKFDVIAALTYLRVAQGYEWFTAFSTRYGHYERLVMPFRLCNALGSF